MPEFMDPFTGMVPGRKLTDRELARALRLALSAEQEAINLYESLADATANKLAAAVLQDIADEEKEHAGEFLHLLNLLEPKEKDLYGHGEGEVDEMVEKVGKPKKASRKKAAPKKKK